jgi:hypothetical protein
MKLQDLGLTTLQSKVLRFIYSYTYLFEVVMLNVILPTVVMLYVVAPFVWFTVAKIDKFPLVLSCRILTTVSSGLFLICMASTASSTA